MAVTIVCSARARWAGIWRLTDCPLGILRFLPLTFLPPPKSLSAGPPAKELDSVPTTGFIKCTFLYFRRLACSRDSYPYHGFALL